MSETQNDSHDSHATVTCDGKGGALGHPKVYLQLGDDGKVVCPYCSKQLTADNQVDK